MNDDIIAIVRNYMKKHNLRDLNFNDYGESTKVTFSYNDGKAE